jgi:tRNA (cytidine/uridine-2'-O-)-methyltransferase
MAGRVSVVLFQPLIPQNTGNIARSCAAFGVALHLVRPLGFSTEAKALRRAGLDYWHLLDVREHRDWPAFVSHARASSSSSPARLVALTARISAAEGSLDAARFQASDYLVFGREDVGLPRAVLDECDLRLRIPMPGGGVQAAGGGAASADGLAAGVRSINLAVAAGICMWEALKQTGGLKLF